MFRVQKTWRVCSGVKGRQVEVGRKRNKSFCPEVFCDRPGMRLLGRSEEREAYLANYFEAPPALLRYLSRDIRRPKACSEDMVLPLGSGRVAKL